MLRKKLLIGLFAFVLAFCIISASCEEADANVTYDKGIVAKGDIWAGNRVTKDNNRITLAVEFDTNTGEIIDIYYTPVNSDTTGGNYRNNWDSGWKKYRDEFKGKKASVISAFTRPSGNASDGKHGVDGLADVVTGATETARNFISSVVTASKTFENNE